MSIFLRQTQNVKRNKKHILILKTLSLSFSFFLSLLMLNSHTYISNLLCTTLCTTLFTTLWYLWYNYFVPQSLSHAPNSTQVFPWFWNLFHSWTTTAFTKIRLFLLSSGSLKCSSHVLTWQSPSFPIIITPQPPTQLNQNSLQCNA